MWLEDVERLEEAEEYVQRDDDHVEQTDTVERQLTIT